MLLVVLITVFIVKKMKLGRKIEAVGNNQRTAYLCGVSVAGTILTVYVLSACFAGVGGHVGDVPQFLHGFQHGWH